MRFLTEFEFESNNGETLYVEVDGFLDPDADSQEKEIKKLTIRNEDGDEFGMDHPQYDEIFEEAIVQEVEVHSRDFDYYDTDINNFLKDE